MPLNTSFLKKHFLVIGLVVSAAMAFAGDNLLNPPPNCASVMIGGKDFVKGEVYLSCHEDTILLKDYGFRNFFFVGRAFRCVKYFAIWPRALDVRELPDAVSGINYDRPTDEMVISNLEKVEGNTEVRAFLHEIPPLWSEWPNVSAIYGSGIENGGWETGGFSSEGYYDQSRGSRITRWGRSYGGYSQGTSRNGPGLRPNDFKILEGYSRSTDGRVYRRW